MDKDVNCLYQIAMRRLMESEAKTYKYFFTQDEFEKNIAEIFQLTKAKSDLETKLNVR